MEPEVQAPIEEEEEEEEDESEWETDTDEDDAPGRKLIKPVFVPKARAARRKVPARTLATCLRCAPRLAAGADASRRV